MQSWHELAQAAAEVGTWTAPIGRSRDADRMPGSYRTCLGEVPWLARAWQCSQVVYFFDPAKALTPKETEFMLLAVKEKLTMILESNPRVAGCVDLGQFEKLKELKENQEIQEMRQALVRKGHEIAELRQTVTQQQEEPAAACRLGFCEGDHMQVNYYRAMSSSYRAASYGLD